MTESAAFAASTESSPSTSSSFDSAPAQSFVSEIITWLEDNGFNLSTLRPNPAPMPVNGTCGSANGSSVLVKPSSNLCTTGTATALAGTGPWAWQCTSDNKGTTASCAADLAVNFPIKTIVASPASLKPGQTLKLTTSVAADRPVSNYTMWLVITSGGKTIQSQKITALSFGTRATTNSYQWTAPTTTAAGTYQAVMSLINAKGATEVTSSATFTIIAAPVNGACGTSSGAAATAQPTVNLCSAGKASAVAGSGPWTWSCAGINGGTNATNCSASVAKACTDSTGATHASGSTYVMPLSQTKGSIAATSTQCAYGGTQSTTTLVFQNYSCTNGVSTKQGNPASTTVNSGNPVCNSAASSLPPSSGSTNPAVPFSGGSYSGSSGSSSSAGSGGSSYGGGSSGGGGGGGGSSGGGIFSGGGGGASASGSTPSSSSSGAALAGAASCGVTPSGHTVTSTVSTTSGTIAATTTQCPYGGTLPTTTVVTQVSLCTNGTLTAQGAPVTTTTTATTPNCNTTPNACGATPSGHTVTNTVSTTAGTTAATTTQCPYGGTLPTTTTVTQVSLCTNGTLTAQGAPISTTVSNGAPTCSPAPVVGVCGSSNGKTLSSAPTANLCSTGSASVISGAGPWTWNCAGANGGASASCLASLPKACTDSTGATHASGSTYTLQTKQTTSSIAATTTQCPYGGTQPTTTAVTQNYSCTDGKETAQGKPVTTTTNSGTPTCKAAAACGSTPSGQTVTSTVSTSAGSIAATTSQCPYGGTAPIKTTVTQTMLCTNGTLAKQGNPVTTIVANGTPACKAAAACGSTPSGQTVTNTVSTLAGSIAATTSQCPNGGTQATTTTVKQTSLCTNGVLSAQGSPVTTTVNSGSKICKAPAAACGSTPSGQTVTSTVSTSAGSIAATTSQCPYGGTQATTTVVKQTSLCTDGTLTAQGSPTVTTVNSGSAVCTPQINGACGASNGTTTASTAPTVGLCSSGAASTVATAGNGLWTWSCAGAGGGTNASCYTVNLYNTDNNTSTVPAAPTGQAWSYVPTLSDEFNGTTLDTTKWQPTAHPSWLPDPCTTDNISVANGFLQLKTTATVSSTPATANLYTTPWMKSGCVTSKQMNYSYGYYEARILIDDLPLDSAFWFRSPYEEIDVQEGFGGEALNGAPSTTVAATTHYYPDGTPGSQETNGRHLVNTATPITDWHIYGVWWKDPQTVLYYLDGKLIGQDTPTLKMGPFNQPQTLWFSAGQPPAQDGRITTLPELQNNNRNTMYVDWVRSYALVPSTVCTATTTVGGKSVCDAPVNGACGTSNGIAVSAVPSGNVNLCSNGTPTAVTGTGPWTWSCTGFNGGTTASCSAPVISTLSKACTDNTGATHASGSTYTLQTKQVTGSIAATTAQCTYGGTQATTTTTTQSYSCTNGTQTAQGSPVNTTVANGSPTCNPSGSTGTNAPVPPGPSTTRSISEWTHCDGVTDDWSGVTKAFAAAKNNAFTLQVDCPVFIHVGMDVARPIFVDNGTYVNFTSNGQFILDNVLMPSFVIADSSNIVFANGNVKYVGGLPAYYHTDGYYNNGVWIPGTVSPAGEFNSGTLTAWLKANRGVTFAASNITAVWHGPTNLSSLFYIDGNSQNVTFVNMHLAVPPNTNSNNFIPMAFSITFDYKPNVAAIAPPASLPNDPNTPVDYAPIASILASPNHLTFSNITIDGYYMGFQGTGQNMTFTNITGLRYGDFMDPASGTVGGVDAWFAPPHLFYLNGRMNSAYDPLNDVFDPVLTVSNLNITHVKDNGPHVGTAVRTVGGFDHSLKVSGVNVVVDDYYSARPDGLMQIYQCNNMKLSNITATYDSSFLHGLYPSIAFPNPGYYQNLTLSNINVTDTASVPQAVPVSNNNDPHWDLDNKNIQFNNVVANLNQLPKNSTGQTITNLQPSIAGTSINIPVTVHVANGTPTTNGACGTSNGTTMSVAPTTNLCSSGTASAIAGSGPWTWSCAGINGGTNASCSAALPKACTDSTGATHASGSTYTLQVSQTTGSTAAGSVCPYGGTQATTTTTNQIYTCTNGTQTAQGSPVTTTIANDAPVCTPAPSSHFAVGVDDMEPINPLPSWGNAQVNYGAKADGVTDDTQALQKALNDLGPKFGVLYLPPGTYKITSTLLLNGSPSVHGLATPVFGPGGVGIVGDAPSDTTIVWAGPKGDPMLVQNGGDNTRYSRITWNGSGTAGYGIAHWNVSSNAYHDSASEDTDEVFENMAIGIMGGRSGAYYNQFNSGGQVRRVSFNNISYAGVDIGGNGAFDWWVWDSQFSNCGRGIATSFSVADGAVFAVGASGDPTNFYSNINSSSTFVSQPGGAGSYINSPALVSGGGSIYAYRNLFKNSTVADIDVPRVYWFSAYHNVSVGSNRFLQTARSGENAMPVIIDGNRIANTTDPAAIYDGNLGPLMLIDNQILNSSANSKSSPVVMPAPQGTPYGISLLSTGNQYTVSTPISLASNAQNRLVQINDKVVPTSTISTALPVMPSTPARVTRTVFEVPAGASAAQIQTAINHAVQAASQGAVNPIVHIPKGSYYLTTTLVIPPRSRIQIVGDGLTSNFYWNGPSTNAPMFLLQGPSYATIRDVWLQTPNAAMATGIAITNADQPGGRIFIEGSAPGLVSTTNLHNTQLQVLESSNISSFNPQDSTRTQGLNLSSTNNAVFIGADGIGPVSLTNGSTALIADTWYEGNDTAIYRMDSGTFTYAGGMIDPGSHQGPVTNPQDPAILLNNYSGSASFLGLSMDLTKLPQRTPPGTSTGIQISNTNTNTNTLFMGVNPSVLSRSAPTSPNYFFNQASSGGNVGLLFPDTFISTYGYSQGGGAAPAPNQGNTSSQFITNMLTQLRSLTWDTSPYIAPAGATDVRIYRIFTQGATQGITITNAAAPVPTVTLAANPTGIVAGKNTTLTWSSTSATSCVASGDWTGTAVGLSGSLAVTSKVAGTHNYILTCTGTSGSGTVTVNPVLPVPTVTLIMTSALIPSGGTTPITWSSTNATSCVASGAWSGTQATSGTLVVPVSSSNPVYTLVCTGSGGTTTQSVTVNVTPAQAASSTTTTTGSSTTPAGSGTGTSTSSPSTPSGATAVNGSCGVANGNDVSNVPQGANLCSSGSASAVKIASGGYWAWSCTGSSGRTTSSCSAKPSMVGSLYTLASLAPNMLSTMGLGDAPYSQYVSPSSPVAAVAGDTSEQFMAPNGQAVTVTIKSPVTTRTYTAPAMTAGENPVTYFTQQIVAAGSGSTLVIPKGTYNFPAIDCTNKADPQYLAQYLVISSLHDFTIDGQGSTLNFTSDCQGVVVYQSTRVAFKNFTIDWPNLNYAALATVTAVGGTPGAYTYDMQVPVDHIVPNFNGASLWDSANNYLTVTGNNLIDYNVDKVTSYNFASDGTAKNLPSDGVSLTVGQTLLVRHTGSGHAVSILSSQDVTLEDVTIYAAPNGAIWIAAGRGLHLDHCTVTRGADRPMSSMSDAVHFSTFGGDVIIENSTFASQGDDGINMHSYMLPVAAAPSCPSATSNCPLQVASGGAFYAQDGDTIALFDPSNKFISAQTAGSCNTPTTGMCIVNMAPIAATGGYATNLSEANARYIVQNNVFSHNSDRGFLVYTPYGLVQNNIFTGQTRYALYVLSSAGWNEGAGAQNVLFLNNQISVVGNYRGVGAVIIASQGANEIGTVATYSSASASNGIPPIPAVNQNIVFANNSLSNLPSAAFYVSSANNVILYNNTLTNTNLLTPTTTPNVNAPVVVYDASNVLLNGNTFNTSVDSVFYGASDSGVNMLNTQSKSGSAVMQWQ